jgi:agmatine deiminase
MQGRTFYRNLTKKYLNKRKKMNKKVYFPIIILCLALNIGVYGQNLTHQMTEEEKALMPDYLKQAKSRAVFSSPSGTIRPIAEFEQAQGALVAYPFGIPLSLIAEMSEDVMVTTIVNDLSEENTVRSMYSSSGVNLKHCNFLYAEHDSYWTRDYGPWFIANDNNIEIIDAIYDRPRPNDDRIPQDLGNMLNINVYSMDLVQTGGNYMTDGVTTGSATDLVWDENPTKTHEEINQMMMSYMGIENYYVTNDPLGEYIKHIDCWGKFLDVDKILIASVPKSNSNYSEYESIASYFANLSTPYGNKYQVYRVYEPNGQPYTNSLILNRKVLVPVTGSSYDADALQAYKNAMPGYEVIGYQGSWETTDALHCRVHEIADLGMLHIDHQPILGEIEQQSEYIIHAKITAFSKQSIIDDSVQVFYKVNSGDYQSLLMTKGIGNSYSAIIPAQPEGSRISYYIHAADFSDRSTNHPYIGKADPHVFTIKASGILPPNADFSANTTTIPTGNPVQFTDLSTNSPTSWAWTFEGGTPLTSSLKNPSVTYSSTGTYPVSLTVANSAGSNTMTKTGYITVEEAPLIYCNSGGSYYSYEWISNVEIGSFSHASAASSYSDFTNYTVQLSPGQQTTVNLTPSFGSGSYKEFWKIWIDYNIDGDFEDSGEEVFSGSGTSVVSGSFTVPDIADTTRMRVSMKFNGAPGPCELFSYGETEDYSVAIANSIKKTERELTFLHKKGSANSFSIYPNPVKENLYIQTEDINAGMKIINAVGAIAESTTLSGNHHVIDVSGFPAGVYTVIINANNKTMTEKFIKQ